MINISKLERLATIPSAPPGETAHRIQSISKSKRNDVEISRKTGKSHPPPLPPHCPPARAVHLTGARGGKERGKTLLLSIFCVVVRNTPLPSLTQLPAYCAWAVVRGWVGGGKVERGGCYCCYLGSEADGGEENHHGPGR